MKSPLTLSLLPTSTYNDKGGNIKNFNMKKLNIFLVIIATLFFTSCEEVVDIPLDTAPPRLVIEANIYWQKETSGNQQSIKLMTTTDFYSNVIPPVNDAVVTVTNSQNVVFSFNELEDTGVYYCQNFLPVLNETYTLNVVYNGEVYTASEVLTSVAPITTIEQSENGGFTGNEIEIKAYFDDPANETNYYLYEYSYAKEVKSFYSVTNDEFFNGNQFFSIDSNEDYVSGEVLKISHIGISQSYYNFLNIILSLAGESGGGPFQTPPATIRGNIINETNASNFALGYFSLSEVDTEIYTIK